MGPPPNFRCLFLDGSGVRRSQEAAAAAAAVEEGTIEGCCFPPWGGAREALAGATNFPLPTTEEKTPLTDRRGLGGDWKGPLLFAAAALPFPAAALLDGIGGGNIAVGEGVWWLTVAVEGLARLVASCFR